MSLTLALLAAPAVFWLDALDLSQARNGFGPIRVRESVDRRPLTLGGNRFERGLGVHAPSVLRFGLDGRGGRFLAQAGVDDEIPVGRGSIEMQVFLDGRFAWTSGPVRGGDSKPVEVALGSARVIELVATDSLDGNGEDHADWADARFEGVESTPRALPHENLLTLELGSKHQTIDNFGASDSWTVEPLIGWPESARNRVADLLFSPTKGIGLSAWRVNLGGGLNPETIYEPLRTVETYETGEGTYDWSRCPGQRWMLESARKRGVSQFVAYAVTPPRRLTLNGFTNGTDGKGTTNLRPGAEPAYARYLADIVGHFRSQGFAFTHVSPINEPDFEWNGVPNRSNQEGNRASNPDIARIGAAIHAELSKRGLPVRLLLPEASSPGTGVRLNEGMGRKYGAEYGKYVPLIAGLPYPATYAYHAYWSDSLGQIVPSRRELRKALDEAPKMPVWQTEFCQMAGPRGEGGWGRDLGMTLALNTARLIHFDLTVVGAQAWQWWLGVSNGDYKDGLVYVDDLAHGDFAVHPSKTLWALGNFSRFVRPGMVRIEVAGPTPSIEGLLASAYATPEGDRVVAVLVNPGIRSEPARLSLPGKWRATAYTTSDRPGDDLRPAKVDPAAVPVPPRSVVTVELRR